MIIKIRGAIGDMVSPISLGEKIFFEIHNCDFIKLLENGDEHNVIVEVGESSIKQPFKVHSTVLCYRCPYLYGEFKKSTISNDDNIRIIQKPQITAKIFNIIIKYIYGATVNLEKVETSVIFDLLMTANEFQLEKLVTRLQIFLIKNQSSWLKLNFSKIYNLSFRTHFKALQKYCNDIIVKHPNLIFESKGFNTIPEEALISIIQRDDLQLEEPKIWDYVIQWGISQNKTLPSNVDDWIDKDFQILKNNLQQCLPHIRYFQISNESIREKVFPYQQILDKKLWDDIVEYSMTPNKAITSKILPPRKIIITQLPSRGYTFRITSSIINIEQATEIASWVDKKEVAYDVNNNPYKFNLILRGSRDGFENKVFWNLCDQKTNVVVFAKVKDTDEILGGYNPIGWNSDLDWQYSKTNASFIFSLKNGNIKKSILSRVKSPSKAIFNNPIFGPNFYNSLFMNGIQSFMNYPGNSIYEKSIKTTYGAFSIDDYEMAIHFKIWTRGDSIRFYGIAQDPETHSYMMVLHYAKEGNLREYLKINFNNFDWKQKFKPFGLSKLIGVNPNNPEKKNIVGVFPYIAPEVLSGDEEYTKAAEVYSFGVIAYEMVTGFPPYPDIPHDKDLAMNICNGLRSKITFHTPKLITRMIMRCWDARVTHRPTFKELYEELDKYDVDYSDYISEGIKKDSEIVIQIKNAEEFSANQELTNTTNTTTTTHNYQTHPQAIYTSRLLSSKTQERRKF
ncbi:hypothetical protein Glove_13g242 [Diversispora epigaea]|uniref:BTB domain-containing protein n=1 Tax=Diversispora epigaea TaxID=1348612 RepID=A0A397JM83_9GLOM|nr:hypothetical protein Glove_13g242 [Diversispora epigaea]